MKKTILILAFALTCIWANAQTQLPKVYNEKIDPITQIDKAVAKATKAKKNVIVQLGGNWCIWCLRFADFITKDADIKATIDQNYEYIHVNIPRRGTPQYEAAAPLQKRLDNAGRFGYPVLVVLSPSGKVLHIQDSSFLESGNSYDQAKVLRFLKNWTPEAVK
jgi:uncharacterized protein YyaL (SSP411 family)